MVGCTDDTMTAMSNDQGNNGQGGPQSQPSSGERNQGQDTSSTHNWDQTSPYPDQSQGQQPGGSWAVSQGQAQNQDPQQQPSARGWSTDAQQQPSASEWHGDRQQWQAQGQPGPPQGAQGWNPAAPRQQGWNPNPQNQYAPGQQRTPRPSRSSSGFSNVFDFSFRKPALPEASGAIFLVVIIAVAIWWLIDLVYAVGAGGGEFGVGAGFIVQLLLSGLARSVLIILAARVLLEGMSALVSGSQQDKNADKS